MTSILDESQMSRSNGSDTLCDDPMPRRDVGFPGDSTTATENSFSSLKLCHVRPSGKHLLYFFSFNNDNVLIQ